MRETISESNTDLIENERAFDGLPAVAQVQHQVELRFRFLHRQRLKDRLRGRSRFSLRRT